MARPIPDLELMEANEAALDDRVIIDDTSDAETKAMEIEQLLKLIIPTGLITPFGGASAPDGFLLCDGAAVSRTTYADLFAVVGTNYGVGDGSSTFNLPNLKGRVPVGLDTGQTEFNTLGKSGGAKTHLLTAAESGLRQHAHSYAGISGAGQTEFGPSNLVQPTNNSTSTRNAGPLDAQQAHNNLQPYLTANFLIKT